MQQSGMQGEEHFGFFFFNHSLGELFDRYQSDPITFIN